MASKMSQTSQTSQTSKTSRIPEYKYSFIFKALADKTLYEVGLEFGFDKLYKDSRAVNNAVYNIYRKVIVDPQRYSVQPETVELVKGVISSRSVAKPENQNNPHQPTTLREKLDIANNKDFKDLVLSGSKTSFDLLNMKMERVKKNKKMLDAIPITSLAQTFGILFDKSRIIQGESTENIAVLAKVDKDMSSEDALQAILKMREINQVDKEKK